MNNFLFLLNAALLVTMHTVSAQEKSLVVSDERPSPGQTLSLQYTPAGTVLADKKDISATVYYWKNSSRPGTLPLKPVLEGDKLKFEWKVPDSVKLIAFKLSSGDVIDANKGEGYFYLVEQDGKVVQGAHGQLANLLMYGFYAARLDANAAKAKSNLMQELEMYPSSKKDFATTRYALLAGSGDASDKTLLEQELYDLLKSGKEQDYATAQRFFAQLKNGPVADSIQKLMLTKFPSGDFARSTGIQVVYNEKDPVKKETAYKAFVKKFPPSKAGGTSNIIYDYARNSVATAYASENNVKKALEYTNMIETGPWKGEGFAGTASVLMKNGENKIAADLLKKAIKNSYEYRTTRKNEEGADFAALGYVSYNNMLAELLLKEKKYKEALPYVKAAYESSSTPRANVNSNYAKVLVALDQDKEAFEVIDQVVKAGQATQEMKEMLKTLFRKVKGSDAGYDEYMASVQKILAAKIRADLARKVINQPAPKFQLKDLDGKVVSLDELKGKTVILDFWATWCGPCIRSFPAMKMAVNKYRDNPDVKFLFIHTWERVNDPTTDAKAFVDKNNYKDFQVLMDLKDAATGTNKVVESFNVTGIPTKFVIDKNGNIRFRLTGFDGGDEAAVEEITAMVEIAQK
jgi:thiol-disulfide isomerase/thioredoxin